MTEEPPISASKLLAALREIPADSVSYAAQRERVAQRLASSLVVAPEGMNGAPPSPDTNVGTPRTSGITARHVVLQARRIAAAWLGPAFVAGALLGVGADRLYGGSAKRGETRFPAAVSRDGEQPVASATATLAPLRAPEIPAEPQKPEVEAKGRANAAPVSSTESASTLGAEQRLLDVSRRALARGEPAAGIGALQRHIVQFPNGQLAEEREALYTRILVALGRDEEAVARAASFHRRFPGSLFAPVVDGAVSAIARRNGEDGPKR
jgi:hypothetical protein